MTCVTSNDGTPIACERSGSGPAVIIVDGALCSRAFGPSAKLAQQLAPHATVYRYDRRGRGESGDTAPYAPAREIEDLAALIAHAGGRASLVGLSSGAALALEAAAAGLPIDRVVAYEPPYIDDAETGGGDRHEAELKRRLARGDRAGALNYFFRDMVQVPRAIIVITRLLPWIWNKLVAVAHTLPHDAAVISAFRIPRARFSGIAAPVLLMHGSKTNPRLKVAALALAAVIPGAEHRELPGEAHNVSAAPLTQAALSFLTGADQRISRR